MVITTGPTTTITTTVSAIDDAKLHVAECERVVGSIKARLRALGGSNSENKSSGTSNPSAPVANSVQVEWTQTHGNLDPSQIKLKVQLSSPVEEIELVAPSAAATESATVVGNNNESQDDDTAISATTTTAPTATTAAAATVEEATATIQSAPCLAPTAEFRGVETAQAMLTVTAFDITNPATVLATSTAYEVQAFCRLDNDDTDLLHLPTPGEVPTSNGIPDPMRSKTVTILPIALLAVPNCEEENSKAAMAVLLEDDEIEKNSTVVVMEPVVTSSNETVNEETVPTHSAQAPMSSSTENGQTATASVPAPETVVSADESIAKETDLDQSTTEDMFVDAKSAADDDEAKVDTDESTETDDNKAQEQKPEPSLDVTISTTTLIQHQVATKAIVLEPLATVTFRITYTPSIQDLREALYEMLNQAIQRKATAVEQLRQAAMVASRTAAATAATQSSSSSSSTDRPTTGAAVKAGFLNKSGSTAVDSKSATTISTTTKAAPQQVSWVERMQSWYERTIGPESLARQLLLGTKNYVIFVGAVFWFHYYGQALALPPPV